MLEQLHTHPPTSAFSNSLDLRRLLLRRLGDGPPASPARERLTTNAFVAKVSTAWRFRSLPLLVA
jgi:hypothetical protein